MRYSSNSGYCFHENFLRRVARTVPALVERPTKFSRLRLPYFCVIKTVGLDVKDGAANESSQEVDATRFDQSWCSMLVSDCEPGEPGESVYLESMIVIVLTGLGEIVE